MSTCVIFWSLCGSDPYLLFWCLSVALLIIWYFGGFSILFPFCYNLILLLLLSLSLWSGPCACLVCLWPPLTSSPLGVDTQLLFVRCLKKPRLAKRLVCLAQPLPKDGGDYACGPVVVVRVELGDKNQNSCYINTKDHNRSLHLEWC